MFDFLARQLVFRTMRLLPINTPQTLNFNTDRFNVHKTKDAAPQWPNRIRATGALQLSQNKELLVCDRSLLTTKAQKLQLIASIPKTEGKIKALHTMHNASTLVAQLDAASHQGADAELCLTVLSVSTRATCCGSFTGGVRCYCFIYFIYILLYLFFWHGLQACPAGALLSSSLLMAFLPYLAFFLHPSWVSVSLLCSRLVS